MSKPIQKRYKFTINVTIRKVTCSEYPTVEDVRSHIEDAVLMWGEGYKETDPMYPSNIFTVAVQNLKGPSPRKKKK